MESPFVSVVIPMRNEESHIGPCLDSVLGGDYPRDRMEILVVDGGSTDRSREAVSGYASRDGRVRLLDNPRILQSAALNIGLAEARGEIIVRMDAHALYAADYLRRCTEILAETGASAVGGRQEAAGGAPLSLAISAAMSSRFGAGDASYRHADRREWTDTVFLGAWRKATLEKAGGFSEEVGVNEDYELCYRLRRDGGRILLDPSIRSTYSPRSSLARLVRQYFRYGTSRVRTLRLHPGSLRWRQMAAPVLVAGLAASAAAAFRFPAAAALVPAAYLAADLAASVLAAPKAGFPGMLALPLVFPSMHLAWGAGFWAGLVRYGVPRLTPSVVWRAIAGARGGK